MKKATTGHYAEQTANAAQLILTDVDKYGGEEALPVRWARLLVWMRSGVIYSQLA